MHVDVHWNCDKNATVTFLPHREFGARARGGPPGRGAEAKKHAFSPAKKHAFNRLRYRKKHALKSMLMMEVTMDDRFYCPCGSGERRQPQYDGHGIFMCYTCTRCHERKMAAYRSDIMEQYECDEPIEPDE